MIGAYLLVLLAGAWPTAGLAMQTTTKSSVTKSKEACSPGDLIQMEINDASKAPLFEDDRLAFTQERVIDFMPISSDCDIDIVHAATVLAPFILTTGNGSARLPLADRRSQLALTSDKRWASGSTGASIWSAVGDVGFTLPNGVSVRLISSRSHNNIELSFNEQNRSIEIGNFDIVDAFISSDFHGVTSELLLEVRAGGNKTRLIAYKIVALR